MAVLPARTFKPRRYHAGNVCNWSGHLPFVSDLIAALGPSRLVELGTHYGESYFGMCQAVEENAVSCMCYAVNTWKGDPHAGFYDESVFDEVHQYNKENYASFSHLLRTTFDAAREHFGDGTVDLLHIDGPHTYDAVRHELDTWFSAVRPGGVMLFHDTVVRHLDFQVWRLWEELARQFSHFEFLHSGGLGVLRKPGGSADHSEFVETIFSASAREREFLRHYYSSQASVLKHQSCTRVASSFAETSFQLFPHVSNGYSEATSVVAPLKPGDWQHIVLELPEGSATGPIRVDPADRPCLIHLARVVVRRGVDKTVVRSWTDPREIRSFQLIADLEVLPSGHEPVFLSTGNDPQFLLPEMDRDLTAGPLVFEAQVRVDEDVTSALAFFNASTAALANRTEERDIAIAARDAALIHTQQLTAEIRNLQAERVAIVAEYRRVHAVNESVLNETASLERRLALLTEEASAEREKVKAEREKAKAEQESAKAEREKAKAEQESSKAEQESAKAAQENAKAAQENAKAEQEKAKAELEKTKDEQEKAKAEQERAKAEQERAKAEQERATAEQERAKAEQERATAEQERATAEQEKAKAELERMRNELENSNAEQANAVQEKAKADQEKVKAEQEKVKAEQEKVMAEEQVKAEQEKVKAEQEKLEAEQEKLEDELRIVYQSRSWRLTAPLRRLFRALR